MDCGYCIKAFVCQKAVLIRMLGNGALTIEVKVKQNFSGFEGFEFSV